LELENSPPAYPTQRQRCLTAALSEENHGCSQVPNAAVPYTLIQTCKLTDVDLQAWLAEVFARIADHPMNDLAALRPWSWKKVRQLSQPIANPA
jgi:hypothetical protein